MKKLLIIWVVLVVFYGCGVKENFKDEADLTSVAGVITEQVVNDPQPGTHLLTDEDGEITPVRSLNINLSDVRYLDNLVELIGFEGADDDVFEATGILVKEVLSNNMEELIQLETFVDANLGFEISYYSDWEIEKKSSGVLFSSPLSSAKVTVSREAFNYNPTASDSGELDSPLMAYYSLFPNSGEEASSLIKRVGFDRLDALEVLGKDNNSSYYLYRSGFIYIITYQMDAGDEESNEIFDQMLSDFRFVVFGEDNEDGVVSDSVNVSGYDGELTVFESLPYYFRGSYPASWYYAGASGGGLDVLHHYSFSNVAVSEGEELVSLDIISSPVPKGKIVEFGGKSITLINSGSNLIAYLSVGGNNFRFGGDAKYEDLILTMASSISAVER